MAPKPKWEHLAQAKHKFSTAKNHHELHHRILSATGHELAFLDEIVSHVSGKREADEGLYPGIKEGIKTHVKLSKEVAAKLAKHTHSKGSLARAHKLAIKAGGSIGTMVATGLRAVWNAAKKVWKYVYKGISLTAKYGKKAATKAAKWIAANPGKAARMVESGIGIVKTILEKKDDPTTLVLDETDPRASKYKRMIESDSSSGEDEKEEKKAGASFHLGGLRPKRKYLF